MWQKPLPPPPIAYGAGTSPIVFDGKVILQRDGNSTDSELLALDARSGNEEWRTPRPLLREGWSTPIAWSHDGVDEIITSGTSRVVAYSARTGEERWSAGGLTTAPITLPVVGDGMLFVSATFAGSPADPLDIPVGTPLWPVTMPTRTHTLRYRKCLPIRAYTSGKMCRKTRQALS